MSFGRLLETDFARLGTRLKIANWPIFDLVNPQAIVLFPSPGLKAWAREKAQTLAGSRIRKSRIQHEPTLAPRLDLESFGSIPGSRSVRSPKLPECQPQRR